MIIFVSSNKLPSYRPLLPDPVVQAPNFTHKYNRYGYCLNNPLKYSDLSGWEYNAIAVSAGGGTPFYTQGDYMVYLAYLSNRRNSYISSDLMQAYMGGWDTYDVVSNTFGNPSWNGSARGQIMGAYDRLQSGTTASYKFYGNNLVQTGKQELSSSALGVQTAGPGGAPPATNEGVGPDKYFEGVPVFVTNKIAKYSAVTLPGKGIYIHPTVENNQDLLRHEFGHILQARIFGNKFYYEVIAPESFNYGQTDPNYNHSESWMEWTASKLSFEYFGRPNDWNHNFNPIVPGKSYRTDFGPERWSGIPSYDQPFQSPFIIINY